MTQKEIRTLRLQGQEALYRYYRCNGTGAIDAICEQLQKELPGLRGFSPESVRKMRSFAEFWSRFINRSSVTTKLQPTDNEQSIESDALTLQK